MVGKQQRISKKFVTFQDADIAVQLFNFIKRVPGIPSEKYDFKVFDEVILAPLGLFYPEIFKYIQERQRPTAKEYETTLLKQIEPSRDIYTNSLNDWRSITQRDCEENMIYCDAKDDLEIIQHALDLNTHIEDLQSKHIEENTDKNALYLWIRRLYKASPTLPSMLTYPKYPNSIQI